MSTSHPRRTGAAATVLIAGLALAVAACNGSSGATSAAPPSIDAGNSVASSQPTSSASTPPSAAASLSAGSGSTTDPTEARPSAQPSPDVASALLSRLATGFAATSTIRGQVTVGPITVPVSGELDLNGADSHQSMTVTIGGRPQTSETLVVGGVIYERRGGLWFQRHASSAASRSSLTEVMRSLTALRDVGVVTKDGRSLHHLAPSGGTTIPLAALGGTGADASDGTATMEFYTEGDGTPAIIAIDATWTQKTGATSTPASMQMEIVFAGVGTNVAIAAPDQVWATGTSRRLGYTLAYPSDWDVALSAGSSKPDYFYGADGHALSVIRGSRQGVSLNGYAAGFVRLERQTVRGYVLTSNTASRVGGIRARRLESHGTYKAGRSWDVTFIVVRGAFVYFLDYASTTPLTAQDRAVATAIAASFAFER